MAAACMSFMGSDKERSMLAIAGVLLLFMGLSHLQQANAQSNIRGINLSLTVPVTVTARNVITNALVGSVVVPPFNLNTNLPLGTNVLVRLTVTNNFLNSASPATVVSVNANSGLFVYPSLIPGRVNVIYGYFFGLIFIPTNAIALNL